MAGELDKGLAELQKVTGTPGYKDAVGYVNLGWVYRNLNKAPESIAAYQKALELDPKQEQAALGLGWAYQYTKEYDKAIGAYEQAMKINPKDASADANLGIAWCYFFKRQVPEAQGLCDKAAAAGRSVTQLKENIDKLEKAIASGAALTEERCRRPRPSSRPGRSGTRRSRPRTTRCARRPPPPARAPRATSRASPGRTPCPRSWC